MKSQEVGECRSLQEQTSKTTLGHFLETLGKEGDVWKRGGRRFKDNLLVPMNGEWSTYRKICTLHFGSVSTEKSHASPR